MVEGIPRIWFVTTCMGRLVHLRESLPSWLCQPVAGWTMVDWSCPEQSGAWVRRHHPQVQVVEVAGQPYFNHSRARNAGVQSLAGVDAEWLCFLDADTRLAEGFVLGVAPLLTPGTFVTGYTDRGQKGLGGLLLVERRAFERAGGYDESIEGYGTNGAEMRVRLFFQGLAFRPLPPHLAEHSDHDHGPELSRYPGDNRESLFRNTASLAQKIEAWERETGRELPRELYKKEKLERLRARREAQRPDAARPRSAPLPRFSIVIETDNLAGRGSLDGLESTLRSLDRQTLSPAAAEEVLLMVRPADLEEAARLRERFPWLQPRPLPAAPPATQDYYYSKMKGTEVASGEVVVLFDSDCRYEPTALEHLLGALAADASAVAVSGQSYVEIGGIHSLAMAIAFVFDRPSQAGQTGVHPSNGYIANIVAFRRQVLLDHPIRSDLPAYRLSHTLQARSLKRSGLRMLRQPQALSVHPPPSLAEMSTRFLLKGHDAVRRHLLLRPEQAGPFARWRIAGRVLAARYSRWASRTVHVIRRDPAQLLRLPFALVLVAYAGLAFAAGALATAAAPGAAFRLLVLRARHTWRDGTALRALSRTSSP